MTWTDEDEAQQLELEALREKYGYKALVPVLHGYTLSTETEPSEGGRRRVKRHTIEREA